MLDPWIIEEILKHEESDRVDGRQVLEIPLEEPPVEEDRVKEEEEIERGVVIVDFTI